jgi:hypothetical protein
MFKRILLALVVPVLATGCIVQPRRPKYVQPQYVAQCPAGYQYDGYNCVRIPHHNQAKVRVEYNQGY